MEFNVEPDSDKDVFPDAEEQLPLQEIFEVTPSYFRKHPDKFIDWLGEHTVIDMASLGLTSETDLISTP